MPKHKGFIVAGLVLVIAALAAPSALSKAGGTDKSLHGTISGTASGSTNGPFSGFVSTLTGQVNLGGPIAGGTGRFEDASGSFDALGSVYVDTFEFSITGVISY